MTRRGPANSHLRDTGRPGARTLRSFVLVCVAFGLVAGCSPKGQVNSDGALEGTVARVWEDGMNLDIPDGNTVRIDTWSVCGDFTAANIAQGDTVQVWASRDLFSYEAWRILDSNGESAC